MPEAAEILRAHSALENPVRKTLNELLVFGRRQVAIDQIEFMQRCASQGMREPPHILDRTAGRHQRKYPVDIFLCPVLARPLKQLREFGAFRRRTVTVSVHEQETSLAFKQVAVYFLAVTWIGRKVQEIVLNLKSSSEIETEADKWFEIDRAAAPD
jgi:hypothetical protein